MGFALGENMLEEILALTADDPASIVAFSRRYGSLKTHVRGTPSPAASPLDSWRLRRRPDSSTVNPWRIGWRSSTTSTRYWLWPQQRTTTTDALPTTRSSVSGSGRAAGWQPWIVTTDWRRPCWPNSLDESSPGGCALPDEHARAGAVRAEQRTTNTSSTTWSSAGPTESLVRKNRRCRSIERKWSRT